MKFPKAAPVDPLSAIPSTASFIAYHAARRPADPAAIVNGREIPYAAFRDDLGRMVAASRDMGLAPGQVAAVGAADTYLHLLAVLAFEALGVTTYSYHEDEAPFIGDILAKVDLVMCAPESPPAEAKRAQPMDEAWYDAVMDLAPQAPEDTTRIGPDTPLRLIKSSGTTGDMKWMIHTGRVVDFMVDNYRFRGGLNRQSRFLVTTGFNLQPYHYFAISCLRSGGTCIYGGGETIADALRSQAVTHVLFQPRTLVQVLDELPADYVRPAGLSVSTVSGPVSDTLRARTRERLADEIMTAYGTMEIGSIGAIGGDGIGTVFPGVRMEVVDDDDRPVVGAPGQVRVQSAGDVGGYLNDPAATGRMFRDGWFYPGDVAVMKDSSTFKLIGRADDLLNIGGLKFSPQAWEEELTRVLPVKDVCLITRDDDADAGRLWVVVVPEDPQEMARMKDDAASLLPDMLGELAFVAVEDIPRTATGKVRRNQLREILAQGAG